MSSRPRRASSRSSRSTRSSGPCSRRTARSASSRSTDVPLYLTEQDVAALLTPAAARAAVEASFERLARGEGGNAPRQLVAVGDGTFAVMHAVDRGLGLAGVKSYAWLRGGTPFVVVLFSLARAEVDAVIEAAALGELRTAAASAVAAVHLAPAGATSL